MENHFFAYVFSVNSLTARYKPKIDFGKNKCEVTSSILPLSACASQLAAIGGFDSTQKNLIPQIHENIYTPSRSLTNILWDKLWYYCSLRCCVIRVIACYSLIFTFIRPMELPKCKMNSNCKGGPASIIDWLPVQATGTTGTAKGRSPSGSPVPASWAVGLPPVHKGPSVCSNTPRCASSLAD